MADSLREYTPTHIYNKPTSLKAHPYQNKHISLLKRTKKSETCGT